MAELKACPEIAHEVLDWVNSNPVVQSLLYDLNLLPECINHVSQVHVLGGIRVGWLAATEYEKSRHAPELEDAVGEMACPTCGRIGYCAPACLNAITRTAEIERPSREQIVRRNAHAFRLGRLT